MTVTYLFFNIFRFEQALQQNEIMDIFFDDWKHLGENIDMAINQAINQLRVQIF